MACGLDRWQMGWAKRAPDHVKKIMHFAALFSMSLTPRTNYIPERYVPAFPPRLPTLSAPHVPHAPSGSQIYQARWHPFATTSALSPKPSSYPVGCRLPSLFEGHDYLY